MIKKINTIVFSFVLALVAIFWTGCSDAFLEEKIDYGSLSPEIYNDYTGAKMRVQDIYLRLLPNARDGLTYRSPSWGGSDIQSQATEEFTGLSWYVNPDEVVSTSSETLNDWFHVNKATSGGPWGEIRNCNDAIEGILGGTLSEEQKNELVGQVYFFRAWQYYLLVKTYGGVPIIDKVQAADVSQASGLAVPRSTTKQCIDFICDDLTKAAGMLPDSWAGEFGRVTRGAALALAGRARLLYASPLFNRADNRERWQAAYDANKAAVEALEQGGFGLAYEDEPGLNAAGYSRMFSDYNSKEAVFVTLYNKVHDDNAAHEIYRNNNREQRLRPSNASVSASNTGMNANAMMLDLFPMADGKKPAESGTFAYDPQTFFMNRDPRFYRTFAFPGVYWRFDGNPLDWSGSIPSNAVYPGPDYVLWSYAWYSAPDRQAADDVNGFGADMFGQNYRGVYVRKRSNDFDMTPAPAVLYRWPATSSENRAGAFGEGAMPHMEIRYAEVLLNLAEAACGIDNTAEALEILKRIRKRAGYDATVTGANYGLDGIGSRAQMFSAILYERQIELAYEGKRFDDMRRWLLWDGGADFSRVEGAPASWTLTGFGANTCTYLGVQPFNGKRRDNVEFHAKATAVEEHGNDPLAGSRPAPLDLKKDLGDQFAGLQAFYRDNLVRKVRRGDEIDRVVTFLPKYYLIGLKQSAQTNNVTLLQTIGWADAMHSNINGTFDPLSEVEVVPDPEPAAE